MKGSSSLRGVRTIPPVPEIQLHQGTGSQCAYLDGCFIIFLTSPLFPSQTLIFFEIFGATVVFELLVFGCSFCSVGCAEMFCCAQLWDDLLCSGCSRPLVHSPGVQNLGVLSLAFDTWHYQASLTERCALLAFLSLELTFKLILHLSSIYFSTREQIKSRKQKALLLLYRWLKIPLSFRKASGSFKTM